MFIVPVLLEARLKSAHGWPVFLYAIDYFSERYFPKEIPVHGAFHAMEYAYLFGAEFPFEVSDRTPGGKGMEEEGRRFKRGLIKAIVAFTKRG